MTSPPDAEDAFFGALSPRERTMLAAWADDGDVPDGLEDRIVAAVLAEPPDEGEGDEVAAAAEVARSRAASEGKGVRLVGWAAAIAAAAAVMLMVRVLPRASEGEQAREVAAAERAAASEPAAARGAELEAEAEPDSDVLAPETACETFDALAAEATLVATRYCSPCHDSADRDAHPGAVGVFDVQQQEWWSFMSDAQIEGARRRTQQLEHATQEERHKLDAFLAQPLEPPLGAG